MQLKIEIRSYCDGEPLDKQIRQFDQFPVLLGRSAACDYYLNDPSRYISSNHAAISVENGKLVLQDTSANGVYVNGSTDPIGRGRSVVLSNSDVVTIGDYTLALLIQEGSANTPLDDFADFDSPKLNDKNNEQEYDPFRGQSLDWTPPSAQSDDPFKDIWEDTPNEPPLSNRGGGSSQHDSNDWADWESALDTEPRRQASIATPPAQAKPEVPDPFATGPDELDWLPGNNNETVSLDQSAYATSQPTPLQPRAEPVIKPMAQGSSPQDRVPSASPPGSARSSGTDNIAAINQLLRAAQLRPNELAHCDEEELLRKSGELLAKAIDAMMLLLQSRAELKNAMRSDVTTLTRKGNNPLKFSFSTADALTKLLSDNTEGYMPADAAIDEAIDDLKLHQVAMIDGMRAAVRSLLLDFNPNMLAKKLEKQGGISANIPITREAKLWDLFCQQYDAIREEAEEDFNELFGAEFRKAYEKSIRKLGRDPDF